MFRTPSIPTVATQARAARPYNGLSPGTAIRDSHEKLLVYRSIASLQEYILAEQDKREVRVHRRVGAGWETATCAGDESIELTSINLTFPLDDIYAGVL